MNNILGANQPYLFPYVGFFQLIDAVDIFVLCGNLQYIRHGWVNRNRMCRKRDIPRYFTFSVEKANYKKNICERYYSNFEQDKLTLLKLMKLHKKAKNYNEAYALIERICMFKSNNVAEFNEYAIKEISKYLQISTKIVVSEKIEDKNFSEFMQNDDKYQRIFDMCCYFNACIYRNAVGGKKLYDSQIFLNKNISLQFVLPVLNKENEEILDIRKMSIVQLLMYYRKDECREILKEYTIEK